MDHKDIQDTIVRSDLEGDTAVLPKITEEMLREAAEQTRRIELAETQPQSESMGDTRRIDTGSDTKPFAPVQEQEQPEYVPPSPIVFKPKSRLRELKRKLVAGPEKRYYDLSEIGFGKLQLAIFLSFLVVVLTAASTVMYAMGKIPAERLKLMIFLQFLSMLLSALLGSFQLVEGVCDIFRFRFSFNTMLVATFVVCCIDGIHCLEELRIPCCAAFSLQVMMSLWATHNRRNTEMGQMDTMRKAVRLHSVVRKEKCFDGSDVLLRSEGEVEDFMDYYQKPSAQEKVLSVYVVLAMLGCAALGVMAAKKHNNVSFGIQVAAISLVAASPLTAFITISRPTAILEKRLHRVGTVLCGWRGIKGLTRRAIFPLRHDDLFPAGNCRMNGLKFYGDRDPDEIIAYATAVIDADGGGLTPLFHQLRESRNAPKYTVSGLRTYGNGGLGGEVCSEPVLVGVPSFLKEMGVEIPEGIRVNQAVYVAIDGELAGLFALTYVTDWIINRGLHSLCSYHSLRPVMSTGDFMLTDSFIKGKFKVNTRRIGFPERQARAELLALEPEENTPGLALVTEEGLASFAYAVTGAKALRRAWTVGTVLHILAGIVGLGIMGLLAWMGAANLLTPVHVLLYELVWLVPGILVTEWTRCI